MIDVSIMRSLCPPSLKGSKGDVSTVRLCTDCGTANHDHHLYCRKCSSPLFRRVKERPITAAHLYHRLRPLSRRA